MDRLGTAGEVFRLLVLRRKFYMFPIVAVLIALAALGASVQTGVVALIYPL